MAGGGDIRMTIEQALESKTVIAIIYHGGSNPGSIRDVLPLRITNKGKLQAKCMTSNAMKLFVFDKIELAPSQGGAASARALRDPTETSEG